MCVCVCVHSHIGKSVNRVCECALPCRRFMRLPVHVASMRTFVCVHIICVFVWIEPSPVCLGFEFWAVRFWQHNEGKQGIETKGTLGTYL